MAAIEAGLGQLIAPVETPRGVFALRTLWKSPLTDAAFAQQREQLRAQLLARRQYEMLESWYQERIAAALPAGTGVRRGAEPLRAVEREPVTRRPFSTNGASASASLS